MRITGWFAALSASLIIALPSCGGGSSNTLDQVAEEDDTSLVVSGEVVSDMIQNISSPVEMANELLSSGVGFSQGTLNAAGQESKYETSFKRAVNLGVYAADLGYINTYGKNLVVVDYLSSIKRLSDGIGVGQFLDFQTLSRMAKDNTNLDSLKQLSVSSFNDIDKYLREQKRSNVSTAIVVGTWVEGIYLTSSVIEQLEPGDKRSNLVNRLGEQKNIVEILNIVVNAYSKTDRDYKHLAELVGELNDTYKQVRITTEMGEPVTKEVNGMLVIEQNEITHVEITDELTQSIMGKVREIRKFMVD